MSADLRRQPRFVDASVVEVEIGSRDELRELWSVDISKGGMFIQTAEPPVRGTRLEVVLQTPDGPLALQAEVVHVVDVSGAMSFGQLPGIGVQFIDLTKEVRERIEHYVDGIASKISIDLALVGAEDLDVLLKEAKRIIEALNASDLYGALQMPPSSTSESLVARIERLCQRFLNPPSDTSPPKAERLRQVARQLEKITPLFRSQLRRLSYDFQRGFVRAGSRRKAGEDFTLLRSVWSEIYADRIAAARDSHRSACELEKACRYTDCVEVISKAIELDPFNLEYRLARESWRAKEKSLGETGDLTREIREIAPRLDEMDDFQVLGVDLHATTDDIITAFNERAPRIDPDRLAERVPAEIVKLATEVRMRMQSAHGRLSNRDARASYVLELTEKKSPAEAAKMKHDIGLAHLRRHDYQSARGFLEAAVELDPQPEYKMNAAWAMIADAEFDRETAYAKARPLLIAAARSARTDEAGRPLIARCHYYLGRLLRDLAKNEDAEKHFDKAVRLDPRLTEAATDLRLIRMRAKKRPGIMEMFARK